MERRQTRTRSPAAEDDSDELTGTGKFKAARRVRRMLLHNYPKDGASIDSIPDLYESEYSEPLNVSAFGFRNLEGWLRSPDLKLYVDVRKRKLGVYVRGKPFTSGGDPEEVVKKDKLEPGKGKSDSEKPANGISFNYSRRPNSSAPAAVGAAPADNAAKDQNKSGEPSQKKAKVGEDSGIRDKSGQVGPGPSSASSASVPPKCCHCLSNATASDVTKTVSPTNESSQTKPPSALLEHPMEFYKTTPPPNQKEPQTDVVPTMFNALVPFNPNGPPPFNLTPPPCGPVPPPNVSTPSTPQCPQLSFDQDLLVKIHSSITSMHGMLGQIVTAQTPGISSGGNLSQTPNDKNQSGTLAAGTSATPVHVEKERSKSHQNQEYVVEKEKIKASTTPLQLYYKSKESAYLAHLPTRVGRHEFLLNSRTSELSKLNVNIRQMRAARLLEQYAKIRSPRKGIPIRVSRPREPSLINPFVIHVNGLPRNYQWENVQYSFPLATIGMLEDVKYPHRAGKRFCNLFFWSSTDARTSFTDFVNKIRGTPLSNVHIDFGLFKDSSRDGYRRLARGF